MRSFVTLLLLSCYVVLVCLGLPNVIQRGRFWAEEGTHFFVIAGTVPWHQALFHSFAGYTNLCANLAGILAWNLAPLSAAPYVTTACGIIVQSFPAIILCMSRQPWLRDRRILMVALCVLLWQPDAKEVWMNSIHSQFFLAMSAAIILALEPETRMPARLFQYLVLFLAPLSGPVGCFCLPLFVARAALERCRERAWQVALLASGTVIQLCFFYHPIKARAMTMDLPVFIDVVCVKHLLLPFLGRDGTHAVSVELLTMARLGQFPLWPVLAVLAVSMIYLLFLVRSRVPSASWLALGGASLTVLSFLGSLGDRAGQIFVDGGNRYFFAPQTLLDLSLLAVACAGRVPRIRFLAGGLLAWLVIVGACDYLHPLSMFSEGPNWRNQVRLWRADPTRPLAIWPPGWKLKIPATDAVDLTPSS